MKKEILLAIIGGCLLGLIIGFGLWRLNLAFSVAKNSNKEGNENQENTGKFSIELNKLSNNDVFYENPVTFSGITKANSKIVISSENKDYFLTSDNKGNFEQNIELIGGVNQIIITAFDLAGKKVEKKILVVYSSEFSKYIDEDIQKQQKEATSSTRGKILQKVTEASYSPKAYLGTITDIAESSIQIKTQEGSIEQLATNKDETSVLKIGKTNKEAALSDVAIGDFIVAMGFKNGNNVLDTKRILVTTPPPTLNKTTNLLRVTKINKKDFETNQIDTNNSYTITPNATTSFYLSSNEETKKSKFADLEEGNSILVVGKFSSSPFNPSSIFILKEN